MKRVIEGWKKACGRYWIPEEKRRTTTIEAHWSRPTKALSIVGELKKMQDLDDLLKPSAWMSMPDPALLIDIYQGVLDYGVNTGALEKESLETWGTAGSDSVVLTESETTDPDTDVTTNKETTTEKTAIAIDGDAGQTISTKLAEVAGNAALTQQVMGVLGQLMDCGAAVAGAVVSGGAGTGGAIAACGKLVGGGAPRTPYMLLAPAGAPNLSPPSRPRARTAIKMIVNAIIAATEHKTTRKPCEEFKAQVYHIGEYTGRAMVMLEEMKHGEADLVGYGMQPNSLGQGLVYFQQMQCMQRIVLRYVKLPGPLLGVSTEADKLTCQGDVTKLDKDEAKSTLALEKMITQWTQWETSSGIRDAIQAREEAKKDAIKLGPLAQIDPILRGVKELLRAVPQAHELDELLAE